MQITTPHTGRMDIGMRCDFYIVMVCVPAGSFWVVPSGKVTSAVQFAGMVIAKTKLSFSFLHPLFMVPKMLL